MKHCINNKRVFNKHEHYSATAPYVTLFDLKRQLTFTVQFKKKKKKKKKKPTTFGDIVNCFQS